MVKKVALLLVLVTGVIAFVNRERIMKLFSEDTRTTNQTEVKLLLREAPSIDQLTSLLIEEGIIKTDSDFRSYVAENNVDTNSFAAGKYVILSKTHLADLVEGFVKAENGHGKSEVKVNVVFNSCYDIMDIGSNVSKCILADSASIVDCILSQETLERYNFTREQIPALFLPATYEMYFDTDAEAFVAEMATIFKAFWNEERKTKMKALGFDSPSKVATLASIVYAEQGKVPEEWPVIAKLYLNRLDKGMKLQSDPTFKFCWGRKLDGVQRLLNVHRDIDCPYNTYKYGGLPPGPIHITPAAVIDAVLNPSDSNYIFMCAKPDYSGEHNFTASGSQHERNAAVYRRWLANELNR